MHAHTIMATIPKVKRSDSRIIEIASSTTGYRPAFQSMSKMAACTAATIIVIASTPPTQFFGFWVDATVDV
ncbi:hypothetical protein ACH4PR_50790 [Streptomyces mirabilis]|uniref:hypothetical protein n=1 Tax=Streptomyces mirabilis TaxID=68239 RepID=UPI0037B3EB55